MRLGLVSLLVDDYDRGIAFFVDVLGWRLVEDIDFTEFGGPLIGVLKRCKDSHQCRFTGTIGAKKAIHPRRNGE